MTFQFRPFDALLGNLGTLKINLFVRMRKVCRNTKNTKAQIISCIRKYIGLLLVTRSLFLIFKCGVLNAH